MKKNYLLLTAFLALTLLQGCLSVETKEYSFKIKKDGSGSAVIRFINIMTDSSDSANIVEQDYNDLMENYLNGNKLESEFINIKNVKKKLFEEDNHLVGELSFDFDNLKDMKFYKYNNDGPWCYYISQGSFTTNESYFSSNGAWGGNNMPVIFWAGDAKKFEFKTTVKAPDNQTMSLIDMWKEKSGK